MNLETLQKIDLEIFKEVINVCDKENIEYFIIGGTLLGAVRHKGFIPWDDDIDIAMTRDNYEFFLEKAPSYLPNHIRIQNFKTDSEYRYYITRIQDTRINIVEKRLSHINKYTHPSIDILPIDGMPNNIVLRKIHIFRILFQRFLVAIHYKDSIDMDRQRNLIEKIIIRLVKHIPTKKIDPYQRRVKLDYLLKKYRVDESKISGTIMGAYRSKELVFSKIWDKKAYYQFEDIKVIGPQDYNQYLTLIYGEYMKLPPEEERKIHFKIKEVKD